MRGVTGGRSISTRLLLALLGALAASLATAWAVAGWVGPRLFHRHMLQAGMPMSEADITHIEMAYRQANLTSLGLGLVVAVVTGVLVSLSLSRSLGGPLARLGAAAHALSDGDAGVRVPEHGSGPEIDQVALAFNQMADRIQATEATRRRLLTDVAHELRTPVSTIQATVEGLQDGVMTWSGFTGDVLTGQVTRLARLADDLDAVSRAEESAGVVSPSLLPVDELLATAQASVAPLAEAAGVQVTVAAAPGTTVCADPERLGQVLTNLARNAVQHTPPGGWVQLTGGREGEWVRLDVVDDGEGIDAAALPHVFERFYRGDPARGRASGGTGVGLTISRALVQAHGGNLVAHSDGPGRGARFTVRLPAGHGAAGAS